jgi:hypothetical protein
MVQSTTASGSLWFPVLNSLVLGTREGHLKSSITSSPLLFVIVNSILIPNLRYTFRDDFSLSLMARVLAKLFLRIQYILRS